MWATIGSIVLKYWVEFILGLVAAGGTYFFKRYNKLEKANRKKEQEDFFLQLTNGIQEKNQAMIQKVSNQSDQMDKELADKYTDITTKVAEAMIRGREESKHDDRVLQDQISILSTELKALKDGVLSIQGKEFKAQCRRLLDDSHELTLDEWEEIDKDHEVYNGLGGNHKGDQLYSLVKKKAEKFLTN